MLWPAFAGLFGLALVVFLIYCGYTSYLQPEPKEKRETPKTAAVEKTESTSVARDETEKVYDEEKAQRGKRHRKKMNFELLVYTDEKLKATIGPSEFEELTTERFKTGWGGHTFGPRLIDVLKRAGITKERSSKSAVRENALALLNSSSPGRKRPRKRAGSTSPLPLAEN